MQIDIFDARLPPGSEIMSGSVFWLGTDSQGRDMLSAMIYGLRSSLLVGVSSGVIALMVGTFIGLVAAYVGGRMDSVLMRVVDRTSVGEGKSVSVRVDLGGRRILKKTNNNHQ